MTSEAKLNSGVLIIVIGLLAVLYSDSQQKAKKRNRVLGWLTLAGLSILMLAMRLQRR